ncbi:hypothetical protein TWF281_002797 [Arthrobotrys megalospora]
MASGVITVRDIKKNDAPVIIGSQNFQAGRDINIGTSDPDEKRNKCLKDLYSSDCDSSATKSRLAQEAGLVKKSFSWIFQNETFDAWLQGGSHRILRITAGPGKGKTMTMIGIIDYLENPTDASNTGLVPRPPTCAQDSFNMSYFFCQGTDERLRNSTGIIKSLLYQILTKESNRDLISHFEDVYNQRGSKMFEGKNAYSILQKILANIITNNPAKQFYFLIDGLDECDDINILLELIRDTTIFSNNVYWLVASRSIKQIEKFLQPYDQLIIRFEDCDTEINHGIGEYIAQKMTTLNSYHRDEERRSQIFKILSDKAEGTYLWLKIAFESLKSRPYTGLEELEQIPTSITKTYDKMLERLQREHYWDVMLVVISTVIVAKRPLRLDELVALVQFDPAVLRIPISGREDLVRELIQCSSFLILHHNAIYFIHYSAKEYFQDQPFVAPRHAQLYLDCLEIFRNPPGIEVDEGSTSMERLEYACCHWTSHIPELVACDQEPDANSLVRRGGEVSEFLDHNFLNWAIALGSLRKVQEGISQLDKCRPFAIVALDKNYEDETLTQSTRPDDVLLNKIFEAQRFLSDSRPLLEKSPFQIHSGILFSPEKSAIKNTYSSMIRPWVKTKPHTSNDWDRCLHVFEEFRAGEEGPELVAISPSAEAVAVGFRWSRELPGGTIQIWDVSRVCMLTVCCIDALNSILHRNTAGFDASYGFHFKGLSFSKDNQKLMVVFGFFSLDGYEDIFCRLDIATGGWEVILRFVDSGSYDGLQRLDYLASNKAPPSLLLSPDGIHCAGFGNGSVIIFKTGSESGPDPVYISHGHSNHIENMVFSPNGQVFATVSKNFEDTKAGSGWNSNLYAEVRVWSVQQASLLHTFRAFSDFYPGLVDRGPSTEVLMCFSRDNKFLAMCAAHTESSVNHIEIWKPSTGEMNGVIYLSGKMVNFSFLQGSSSFICSLKDRAWSESEIHTYKVSQNGSVSKCHDRISNWIFYTRLSDSRILCRSCEKSGVEGTEWLIWDLATNDVTQLTIPVEGNWSSAISEDRDILVMASNRGLSLWITESYLGRPLSPGTGTLRARSAPPSLWSANRYKELLPLPPSLDYFFLPKNSFTTSPLVSSVINVCNEGLSFWNSLSIAVAVNPKKTEKLEYGKKGGHDMAVSALSLSTDGTKLATAAGEVCVWNSRNQEIEEAIFPEEDTPRVRQRVTCLLFSSDDRYLFLWDELGSGRHLHRFHIYDLCKDAKKPDKPCRGWCSENMTYEYPITAMVISPDGEDIMYASETNIGSIHLELPAPGKLKASSILHTRTYAIFGDVIDFLSPPDAGPPLAASYSQDGKLVAFAHQKYIKIYDTDKETARLVISNEPIVPHRLSFCSRGSCLNLGKECVRVELLTEIEHDETATIQSDDPLQDEVGSQDEPSGPAQGRDDEHTFHDLRSELPCLYFQDDWIWFGVHQILWVPRLYRPERYSCTEEGTFVVGCPDGKVYTLALDLKALSEELGMDWEPPKRDQFCICEH